MDEDTILSKGRILTFSGAIVDDNQKYVFFWIEHNRYPIREMIYFPMKQNLMARKKFQIRFP